MPLILITEPTAEPVTLAEAKAHCRVEVADDDALIGVLIGAAREQVEHILGRALMTQTWERVLDAFPAGAIELGMPPVQSITSIKYLDAAGAEQTLAPSAYALDADSLPGWALPDADTDWPDTQAVANAVRVRFAAGYASAAAVPDSIKQWILIHVGYWYGNREAAAAVEMKRLPYVDCLLDRWRVWSVG